MSRTRLRPAERRIRQGAQGHVVGNDGRSLADANWLAGEFLELHRRYGRGLDAWLMLRGYGPELCAAIRQAVWHRDAA